MPLEIVATNEAISVLIVVFCCCHAFFFVLLFLERALQEVAKTGRLPVVNFAAGGIATPADAALMMQLGVDGESHTHARLSVKYRGSFVVVLVMR